MYIVRHNTLMAFGLVLCALLCVVPHAPAMAVSENTLLREARRCTQHFARQERVHGIPTHLLAAIAATETGRYHKSLGLSLPWPWTINAEGKGYFFNSKAEALEKVRTLQAGGMKSIDVGCMQVNLKHHSKAFASLDQAFDPYYNVAYAGKFLRRNYKDLGDWTRAAAAYHSRTPKYGNRYIAKVKKKWVQLANKMRDAKTSKHVYNMASFEDEGAWLAGMKAFSAAKKTKPEKSLKHRGSERPSKSIKSIKVSDAAQQPSGQVLVIRPASSRASANAQHATGGKKPAPMIVADARGSASTRIGRGNTELVTVSSGNASSNSRAISASKNPVFIFND